MKINQLIIMGVIALGVATSSLATPLAKSEVPQPMNTQSVALKQSKLSLNTATVREFIKIKGIKPNNAKALVRYRKKHGEYKSVEEIASVKGFKRMKATTLRQIEDQLTV